MEALLISTGLVAVAEIGDKTQLLAIVLAARFRRPLPIILGILAATILNHTLAAARWHFDRVAIIDSSRAASAPGNPRSPSLLRRVADD